MANMVLKRLDGRLVRLRDLPPAQFVPARLELPKVDWGPITRCIQPSTVPSRHYMATHDFTLRRDGDVRCCNCQCTDTEILDSFCSCEFIQANPNYLDEYRRRQVKWKRKIAKAVG